MNLLGVKVSKHLTFTNPNSADDKVMICFFFFPENGLRHFMQIVPLGVHEMLKPVFWEK